MTFELYWTKLLKQWKLILICFVVTGLGAFSVSKFITPMYQSTAVIQITIHSTNSQSDINSLLASDQLVQTEAQLATTDPVLREVASHHPGLLVETLNGEVTSTPKLNTQLFEISVEDSSPSRAAVLANDIANVLIMQQLQVTQQENNVAQQQISHDLLSTQQQIDTTANQLSQLQTKGRNQEQLRVLQTQLSGLQQHYNQGQTALTQLELTQAQSPNTLRVAQPAQLQPRPVRPNILLNTGLGLLAGLLLGVLLALLFEQLDTHVRTSEALAQLLDVPVLATIWQVNSAEKEQVVNPTGHNANSESYRILRTNIGFSGIDQVLHSLMVTSALPQDGKSVIASNLAIFMAKAGKNTLLIDADLRRPTLHEKFGLSGDRMGLSNAILTCGTSLGMPTSSKQFVSPDSSLNVMSQTTTMHLSLDPFVHSVGIPNLRIMPSGPMPPNPSELLDSKAMGRLFEVIERSGAEVVIFDTPPLLGLSDASILARKVDGVLIVADITRDNKKHLHQMKAILTHGGSRILGCVVNRQRRSRHDHSYSYYYGHSESGVEQEKNVAFANAPLTPIGPINATNNVNNPISAATYNGKYR